MVYNNFAFTYTMEYGKQEKKSWYNSKKNIGQKVGLAYEHACFSYLLLFQNLKPA